MMSRYWVNQPSTLQPDHASHGARVLAELPESGYTDGPVCSQRMSVTSLSKGWPDSRLAAAVRAILGTEPDRYGYRAAAEVLDNDKRAELRAALEVS